MEDEQLKTIATIAANFVSKVPADRNAHRKEILEQLSWNVKMLKRQAEWIAVREEIKAKTYAIRYVCDWNQWPCHDIDELLLERSARIVCHMQNPLEAEWMNWTRADEGNEEEELETTSWMKFFDFTESPDCERHHFQLPDNPTDVSSMECDTNDGYKWAWITKFKAKLYYPHLSAQPEDGRYCVVYSKSCIYYPGHDAEMLTFAEGPSANLKNIEEFIAWHGGKDKVAVWWRWPPLKRRKVVNDSL